MEKMTLDPAFDIEDLQALAGLYGPTHEMALLKCQPTLGTHAREFISRSPFLCIGTQSAEGKADISPRGDPVGFVQVLDDKTLAIPDRPGNNRLDTLRNILSNPTVGLLFMVPGFDDTLRANGRARLSRDPALLARLQVNGRLPTLAIVVEVEEVFMHCAKAFRRSNLWNPGHYQDRKSMPSLMKIILDETKGAPADEGQMRKLDDDLEVEYRNTMY